jgi:glycosyltransferase involved in cell wall biosynthesis
VKRVLVITSNPAQASFRLRIGVLVEPLSQRGLALDVQVRPRSFLARRKLLRSAADYDAVILQRKMPSQAEWRILARCARPVFLDVDDAIMYRKDSAGWIARWRAWRRFLAMARNVTRVAAGNAYLAELFGRQRAPVSILPTVADVNRYPVKAHNDATSPTLVWIGSHTTLPYLRQLQPALAEAARRVAGLKLLTIADETLASCPLPLEHVAWSLETEAASLCRGDIGIAPMTWNRWTAGKCGFKIVQYMAAGLPVIASPVGANSELVIEGQTGLLPATLADWPAAIAKLADDPSLRARMGAAGRRRAECEFNLQRATDFWVKLLREA